MPINGTELLKLISDNRIGNIVDIISGINLSETKRKFSTDSDRIKAFIQASIYKILGDAILVTDLLESSTVKAAENKASTLQHFIKDFYEVLSLYAEATEGLKKFQFPKDLWSGKFKDPWKGCREAARAVNQKWGLGVDL